MIRDELLHEYGTFVERETLQMLLEKVVGIYEYTAPNASLQVAGALCRLSLEWWIVNSILDHKCDGSVSLRDCRRLLLENAMMFWDEDRIPSPNVGIHPLQRGFQATAKLCWSNRRGSRTWTHMIASELLRYISSRNIGVEQRVDTFDSAQSALRARCDDGGMVAQLLLTELVAGPADLRAATRHSAVFADVLERLSAVAVLINDIASFQGDRASGALNVTLFLYVQRCPPMAPGKAMQSALMETCALIRREYTRFLEGLYALEAQSGDSREPLQRYTDYLRSFARRYWNWQLSCRAYFDPDHPVAEFRMAGGS